MTRLGKKPEAALAIFTGVKMPRQREAVEAELNKQRKRKIRLF